MSYATEIDFSDANKANRQIAEFDEVKKRMTEAIDYIKDQGPGSKNWIYAIYFYFLMYGKNFKKLIPVTSKLHWVFAPIIFALSEALSYQAKRLYVKEVDLSIPFVDKYLIN